MTESAKTHSATIGMRCGIGLLTLMFLLPPTYQATADEDCDMIEDQRSANECIGLHYQKADDLLNETYKTRMRALNGDHSKKHALIASERKWLSNRAADCKQEAIDYDVIGVTFNLAVMKCETNKAIERAAALRKGMTSRLLKNVSTARFVRGCRVFRDGPLH